MPDDLVTVCASALLTRIAIRILCIPEEVIAGFIVIAILVGEVCEGRFPGLKGCHCDYLSFVEVIISKAPAFHCPRIGTVTGCFFKICVHIIRVMIGLNMK